MIVDLGLIGYEEAYRIQKEFVSRRKLDKIEDTLLFAEHPPVFTIGRTGKIDNLIVSEERLTGAGIKVIRVDRGGDITFHGPGQLAAYPIIDLEDREKDLHQYLRWLEDIIIALLKTYDISAGAVSRKTGVWVEGRKVASIGVAASNWVTFHGVAVNLNTDLSFFDMINPCGMKDVRMTSVENILGHKVSMGSAKRWLADEFSRRQSAVLA